jgi:hypothetical protein
MSVVRVACSAVVALVLVPATVAAPAPMAPASKGWGKPVNGLQAGLRVKPDGASGTAVAMFDVVIRNVSHKEIELSHLNFTFCGKNADGVVSARGVEVWGGLTVKGMRLNVKVAPGAEYVLGSMPIFRPGEGLWLAPPTQLRPGKYRVGVDRVEVRIGGRDVTLATGYLNLKVPSPRK